ENPSSPKNRPRVFDRGADVEVLTLRIVSRDEVEAAVVFVVDAGWIHESAGTGWLERFGQLPNFEADQISRQGHQMIIFQEADHFGFAAFVGFQKIVLIFWDGLCPQRIR